MNCNLYDKVLNIYISNEMKEIRNNISANICLNACINLKDEINGKLICNEIHLKNYSDIELQHTMINFYGNINELKKAENMFDNLKEKNVISFSALMKAYLNNEKYYKIIELYFSNENIIKNSVCYNIGLNACAYLKNEIKGKHIIDEIYDSNIEIAIELYNAIINFYGCINDIVNAELVFNSITNKDIVTINTLMNVYKLNEKYMKGIELFNKIDSFHVIPNIYTYSIALYCCGDSVGFNKGIEIIKNITTNEIIYNNIFIQCAIIAFYGKICDISKAINIFNDSINKFKNENDIEFLYSTLMDCYCKIGDIQNVLHLFYEIKDKNIKLTSNIYGIVINGCAHSGFIKEGIKIYNEIKDSNILKDSFVLTSIIDCHVRQNDINTAKEIYEYYCNKFDYYYKHKINMLTCILSGCRIDNNEIIGENIIKQIEYIYKQNNDNNVNTGAYVLLSNIYGKNKKFSKLNKLRKEMKEKKIFKKIPGISWIEIDSEIYEFMN